MFGGAGVDLDDESLLSVLALADELVRQNHFPRQEFPLKGKIFESTLPVFYVWWRWSRFR